MINVLVRDRWSEETCCALPSWCTDVLFCGKSVAALRFRPCPPALACIPAINTWGAAGALPIVSGRFRLSVNGAGRKLGPPWMGPRACALARDTDGTFWLAGAWPGWLLSPKPCAPPGAIAVIRGRDTQTNLLWSQNRNGLPLHLFIQFGRGSYITMPAIRLDRPSIFRRGLVYGLKSMKSLAACPGGVCNG